jgi:alpha-N-acetylglucosaminidase
VLPLVSSPLRVRSPYRWRYYFNYCTFSYSLAFWDWPRWEREIDWMALSGINLPLAIVGQEAVWQRVYRGMGLSDEELGDFFAGPAFLAWGWMGNLDGWGGPSPQSWIDGQAELQKKIVNRMRDYGIKPVLPAFTGHVPAALARRCPNAQCRQMEKWAETFTGTWVLDATDPLFQEIGRRFITAQREMYGVDPDDGPHFYSCDTFNENCPLSDDPAYLKSFAGNIYSAMAEADPEAVWVMQDWMFHFNPTNPDFWQKPQIDAFLSAVPDERMLILDLHSDAHPLGEKTGWFSGKPWAWCFLHNFGGHQSMYGNLDRLAADPPAALDNPAAGDLVGFGLTPEGIEQNPVMYDLATDMMWRAQAPEMSAWLSSYARRRYGKANRAANQAWEVLRATAYNRPPEWGGTVSSLLNLAPRLNSDRIKLNYAPVDLIPAWEKLQQAGRELSGAEGFRYDLVNTARQVLSNLAVPLLGKVAAANAAGDADGVREAGRSFVELVNDVDALLATRREFLLGRWISAASAWGTTDAERAVLEYNARLQITLWGQPHGMLRDYARKEWSGLLRDFYAVRWQRYFDVLADGIKTGRPLDEKAFQDSLRAWEDRWTRQRNSYPTRPTGDAVAVSQRLLEKYRPVLAAAYA